MLKLIGILGVVSTTMGSGVAPTLNSVISKEHQNKIPLLNNDKQYMNAVGPTKDKLGFNEMNIRILDSQTTQYELYLTPELIEQIQRLVNGYSWDSLGTKETISTQFRKLISDYVAGVDLDDNKLMKELESLWREWDDNAWDRNYWGKRTLSYNWKNIWKTYVNSARNQRIKIVFHGIKRPNIFQKLYLATFQGYQLVSENKVYFNKFSAWLERDFNNEINPINGQGDTSKSVRLGILPDDSDDSLRTALKKRYFQLSLDNISIVKKTDYSHFTKGYLLRIKVNEDSWFYSSGEIQTDFFFNTEANVKRINDIFANDQNVQLWLENIKDWDISVRRQIKEDLPNFSEAEKRTWKDNLVERTKTYIRDWYIIQKLIDHDIKLEELNNSVNDVKKDLDTLKEQMEIIQKQIVELHQDKDQDKQQPNVEHKSLEYLGTVSKFIPFFGSISTSAAKVSNLLWNSVDALKKMN